MEDRIEFDSVITEKALNDFKMYHVFHNVGGVFGYVFAAFAIVMCVLGVIFKMSPKYIVMMGLFGVFFFFYPIVNMRLGTKKQMKTVVAFKEPMHYSAGEDKIIVSQGDMSEELAWEQIYKIRFTGSNLILYLSSVRANVLTVNSMGEAAVPFVKMWQKKIYCLNGDLGVGKTVFTQGFAKGLGIEEPVNSPTFTIIQEYHEGRLPLYHFDVYRIGDVEEMDELGYEEYFYSDGVCLIEWSTLIQEIIPDNAIEIVIEKNLEKGFDYRKITIGQEAV